MPFVCKIKFHYSSVAFNDLGRIGKHILRQISKSTLIMAGTDITRTSAISPIQHKVSDPELNTFPH